MNHKTGLRHVIAVGLMLALLIGCAEPIVAPSVPATEPAFQPAVMPTRVNPSSPPEGLSDDQVEEVRSQGYHSDVAVTVPMFMYFLERYFEDFPAATRAEQALHESLDENREGIPILRRALEYYQQIPEETKLILFDPPMVETTRMINLPLDIEFVHERVGVYNTPVVLKPDKAPAAPSALTAENAYQLPNPDIAGSEKYQIRLTWQDNSNDEHGFAIYRKGLYDLSNSQPVLVSSVSPNTTTYMDPLSKPTWPTEQYCYWLSAFKYSKLSLPGQPPPQLESDLAGVACSPFGIEVPPPLPDSDGDGYADGFDKCPDEYARTYTWGIEGCPDFDEDGVSDKDDNCLSTWGDTPIPGDTAVAPTKGCPYRYNIRWLDMTLLNNSGPVAYPNYGFPQYNEGIDPFDYGEEPYLLFGFINGMHPQGMPLAWTSRWCCGEKFSTDPGNAKEPDTDSLGEEFPHMVPGILDHGLTVFPGIPAGQFAEIDSELGLIMDVTLMERDWTTMVTPASQQAAFGAVFQVASSTVSTAFNCGSQNVFGCMQSIAGLLKSLIDWGMEETPKPIEVDDPDDYMGTDVWTVARSEAQKKTMDTGGYGFWFDMPTTYYVSCLGWVPCPAGQGVPTTMRVRLDFCLYREGIPESQIKQVCSSPVGVIPFSAYSP